jgi:hypothetical protein
MNQPIDIVFSFDTTGSMYPCLAQVRREIAATAKRLFNDVPNLRIGLIAHGDYCDERSTYVTKHLQLTSDPEAVSHFVNHVSSTGGGDWPECYELVLHEAHSVVQWRPDSKRVLAVIGDAIPHPPAHNPKRLDWRKELDTLTSKGVLVHGVQALNEGQATAFYAELAHRSGGAHIKLSQFSEATEMFLAVVYQQQSPEALQKYEEEVTTSKRMTRTMSSIFDSLNKRDSKGRYRKVDAKAVAEGRFQQIPVDYDQPIKQLVEASGLVFKTGRGFYEFTKRETIQAKKEIVILDKETGDMYQGSAAREVLGLPEGESVDIKPTFDRERYTVFVQSTSNNRKLIGDTTFLYEAVTV